VLPSSAIVKVSNDLPNSSHLEINEDTELLAGDTQLAPSRAQTSFGASESDLARSDRQLRDLCADALCHCPTMMRYRVEILRHPILTRFRPTEFGRIVRLLGSEAIVRTQTK
jgi:hypothetical protein